jgi:hypothetical protein
MNLAASPRLSGGPIADKVIASAITLNKNDAVYALYSFIVSDSVSFPMILFKKRNG